MKVRIANENTWSTEKYDRELAKTVQLRDEAKAACRRAMTQAKRVGARRFAAC